MEFLDIPVSGFQVSEHSQSALEGSIQMGKYISGPYVMGDGEGWYVGGVTLRDDEVSGTRITSYMSEDEAIDKLNLYL